MSVPELEALPPTPPEARQLFGQRLAVAQRYVEHLAGTGVQHGLMGPREVPRLWGRHVLNCAVLTEMLPEAATVADVGSGAGLPGIAVAIRRPDLRVTLVEPLLRRVTWLQRVVQDLELSNVSVYRGRAQEAASVMSFDFVTARAVAPLETLIEWAMPLLVPEGLLLAMKGQSAAAELARSSTMLTRTRLMADLVLLAEDLLPEPTRVIKVRQTAVAHPSPERKAVRRARRRP